MGELMKSFCLFCPKTALQNLKTGKDVIVIVFFVCSSKLWACGWNPIWCNHLNETSPGTIWFVYQVVLSCNPVRLWCYRGNETSSAVLSHGSICFVCSSDFWACSSGGSRGGALGARAPPLFFDQNEARRAEKKFVETGPRLSQDMDDPSPPPIWRSGSATGWMKPLQQHFYTVAGLYVVLSREPVDEILYGVTIRMKPSFQLYFHTVLFILACVASVSSRRSSRKLGQDQKKLNDFFFASALTFE